MLNDTPEKYEFESQFADEEIEVHPVMVIQLLNLECKFELSIPYDLPS